MTFITLIFCILAALAITSSIYYFSMVLDYGVRTTLRLLKNKELYFSAYRARKHKSKAKFPTNIKNLE